MAEENIDTKGASFYALHVALQTLKERCKNLQERVATVCFSVLLYPLLTTTEFDSS